MALDSSDFYLVDTETGMTLGADTTVVVPEVLGELAYDILYEPESAIEYGDQQGLALSAPGVADLEVSSLADESRGYLAIDTETGVIAPASSLRLLPGDETAELLDESLEEIAARAKAEGLVPTVPSGVLDLEGLPFSSVNA